MVKGFRGEGLRFKVFKALRALKDFRHWDIYMVFYRHFKTYTAFAEMSPSPDQTWKLRKASSLVILGGISG